MAHQLIPTELGFDWWTFAALASFFVWLVLIALANEIRERRQHTRTIKLSREIQRKQHEHELKLAQVQDEAWADYDWEEE